MMGKDKKSVIAYLFNYTIVGFGWVFTKKLLYLLGSIVLGSLAVLMGQLTATFFNKL